MFGIPIFSSSFNGKCYHLSKKKNNFRSCKNSQKTAIIIPDIGLCYCFHHWTGYDLIDLKDALNIFLSTVIIWHTMQNPNLNMKISYFNKHLQIWNKLGVIVIHSTFLTLQISFSTQRVTKKDYMFSKIWRFFFFLYIIPWCIY